MFNPLRGLCNHRGLGLHDGPLWNEGFLIIDKLHIKRGAMIGLSAKILGGVTIGEKAVVAPNTAVLPKTIIKDGEKFGVPVSNGSSSVTEAS